MRGLTAIGSRFVGWLTRSCGSPCGSPRIREILYKPKSSRLQVHRQTGWLAVLTRSDARDRRASNTHWRSEPCTPRTQVCTRGIIDLWRVSSLGSVLDRSPLALGIGSSGKACRSSTRYGSNSCTSPIDRSTDRSGCYSPLGRLVRALVTAPSSGEKHRDSRAPRRVVR